MLDKLNDSETLCHLAAVSRSNPFFSNSPVSGPFILAAYLLAPLGPILSFSILSTDF